MAITEERRAGFDVGYYDPAVLPVSLVNLLQQDVTRRPHDRKALLTEIDGISWCLGHESVWFEGETCCRDAWAERSIECVEALLFHGMAPL